MNIKKNLPPKINKKDYFTMNFSQYSRPMRSACLPMLMLLAIAVAAKADVRPAGIFSSDMVLQRNQPIVIWGWADKGERVSVTFNNATKKVKPDASGKWKVTFAQMQAGGPYEMVIKGKNQILLNNILIGDIWVCSGQSTMGFALKRGVDAGKETAAANYPPIRRMTIPRLMPSGQSMISSRRRGKCARLRQSRILVRLPI